MFAHEGRFRILLVKLLAFSFIYGWLWINWIDLFGANIPAYHLWFVGMLFLPFVLIVVFDGLRLWELTVAFGFLTSLWNDLFYYVVGDLLFGFHVPLFGWYLQQLGFDGNKVLFVFQGGFFSFPVTSWMMGAAVYLRILVVALVLRHYWNRSR